MPKIDEVREKYPEYNDLSDKVLGDKFYTKFYSDMPRQEFDQKFYGAFQGGQPKPFQKLSPKQTFQGELRPLFMQPPGGEGSFAKPSRIKSFIEMAAPIASDIGMTMVAPQTQGAKIANLIRRSLFSGIGSAGGSAVGQHIGQGKIDPQTAMKEGLLGLGGELGISTIGRPAKWVAEKVAKPTAQLMSAITATSMKVTKAMKDRIVKKSTDRALKFIEDLAPDVVKRQDVNLGSIGAMVESAVSEKRAMYDFYESILRKEAEKSGGVIQLPNTVKLLEDQRKFLNQTNRFDQNKQLAQRFNAVGVHNDFKTLVQTIRPTGTKGYLKEGGEGIVDPKVITNILATVFKPGLKQGKKGFHQLGSQELKDLRTKLKEALLDDLSLIQSKVEGKTAIQAKKEADEMTKALGQFTFIKQLFDSSTTPAKFGTNVRLAPNQLADKIMANKTKILRDMPDLWPKLKAEADYFKSVAKDFSEVGLQKQDAFRLLGGPIGFAVGGTVGVPLIEGMGAASAYFLMSPKKQKLLRKIVYTSIKSGSKAGIHMGGRLVNFPERGR